MPQETNTSVTCSSNDSSDNSLTSSKEYSDSLTYNSNEINLQDNEHVIPIY